jgi:hypothetical protein
LGDGGGDGGRDGGGDLGEGATGGIGGWKRTPQSSQSVPRSHTPLSAFKPPSSQKTSVE